MAARSSSTTAQQSDNIAHAISGAGGGILSMALTYAAPKTALLMVGTTELQLTFWTNHIVIR